MIPKTHIKKEGTSSTKLSSDLHTNTVIHIAHTYIKTYTHHGHTDSKSNNKINFKPIVQKKLTTDITEMSGFMNVCLGTMCMQGLRRLKEGVRVPGAGVADGWLEDTM